MKPTREELERLLQEANPDAEVIAVGPHETATVTGKNPQCDFCSSLNPVHVFKAEDVYVGNNIMGDNFSLGDWGACLKCKTLIEQDDREGLLVYCTAKLVRKHPGMDRKVAKGFVRQAHQAFFKARKE